MFAELSKALAKGSAAMRRRSPIQAKNRAFTLVEMLIVGALIALFAGMAIFGVQQQFRSNQRKAVIGETRQLATALDFAYDDIGIFPKIAFLQNSVTTLNIESQREYGNRDAIFRDFQTMGVPTELQALSIADKWKGPYFAASQSRSRSSQGRGGSRFMLIANRAAGSNGVQGFSWPVDTFNNPYMLYCLSADADSGGLYFALQTTTQQGNTEGTRDATITGNAFNAVVSYGPNQVPGGGENTSVAGGPTDTGIGTPFGLRLYTGNPADESTPLRLLDSPDLFGTAGAARANVWGTKYATNAGTGTSGFAFDDNGTTAVGITDVGSDDVVFTF